MPQLIQHLSNGNEGVIKVALNALQFILCDSDDQVQVVIDCNIMSHFPALLNNQDQKIRNLAVCCSSNIAAGSTTQKQAVIESGLLPVIVKNLTNSELETKHNIARLLRNLTYEADKVQMKQILEAVELKPLYKLIESQDTKTVKVSS